MHHLTETPQKAKLFKQLQDEHEADGEDEDEEEGDGEQAEVWRRRRVYEGEQSTCDGLSGEVLRRRVQDAFVQDDALKLRGKH